MIGSTQTVSDGKKKKGAEDDGLAQGSREREEVGEVGDLGVPVKGIEVGLKMSRKNARDDVEVMGQAMESSSVWEENRVRRI